MILDSVRARAAVIVRLGLELTLKVDLRHARLLRRPLRLRLG